MRTKSSRFGLRPSTLLTREKLHPKLMLSGFFTGSQELNNKTRLICQIEHEDGVSTGFRQFCDVNRAGVTHSN